MHRTYDQAKAVAMFPGVVRRTVNAGDRTTMVEIAFAAGAEVPTHTHMHEQIGYLVSGRVIFRIADEAREMHPGDSWAVLGDVPPSCTALEPSVMVEVFSPVRTEYVDF